MYKTNWDFKNTLGFSSYKSNKIKLELNQAKSFSQQFITTWQHDLSYLKSTTSLLKALRQYEAWISQHSTCGNVDYYLSLRQALNQNSSIISGKLNKLSFRSKKIENDIQFFLLKLSKVSKTNQKKFLKSKKLLPYRNFLKNLFNHGSHLLSDPEEKILNLTSQVSYSNWVKMTSRLLSISQADVINETGQKQTLSFSKISSLIDNSKFSVAKSAGNAFTKIVDNLADVAESELNSLLEDKYIEDKLRHYSRPDSARHLSDDIDTNVVDSLINTVTKNFKLSKSFYKFKAKLLKRDKLPYFWKTVSLNTTDQKFNIDQSIDIITNVLLSLDPTFSSIFQELLTQGQIDFFPKKGKMDGAFCSGGMLKSKTFILLNFTNKLRDLTTIAHEMGHAINNELMRQTQTGLNFDLSLATAEVASTFFENFVFEHVKSTLAPAKQFNLLVARLDDEVSTIFRQVACYNFEQELHQKYRQKGYLSKKIISQIFLKHMSSYLGEAIDLTGFDNWWVYWSHIRDPFYVYSYASGLLISKYLQNKVREDRRYITSVKKVLSSGTSLSPTQVFKSIGLDISSSEFWQQGVNQFKDDLNQAIFSKTQF